MSAGRPVSFWIRHEFIEDIDAAADKRGMSRSEFVLEAIARSVLETRQKPQTKAEPAE